jgi:glutamine amidotransferase
MPDASRHQVAIVDYRLGNLYSVKHACTHAGLNATITSSGAEILKADAVILPGVGAFGDAMATLHSLDLVSVLRDFVASSRPLLGVCLGQQLIMTESHEFGHRKGLGLIEGDVVKFERPHEGERMLKVPHIGWNGVHRIAAADGADPWNRTLLEGLADGEPMYFVHSYFVRPSAAEVWLATSEYGGVRFCSAVQHQNVMACQFHPERSGPEGLKVYRNLAARLTGGRAERPTEPDSESVVNN